MEEAGTGIDPLSDAVDRGSPGGQVLQGRYALDELIGSGRTSQVYRARDLQRRECIDGQLTAAGPIAVKLLRGEWRADHGAVSQLQREFRQMRRLAHPGIARVFYLGRDADSWFITMEFIDGQTAATWIGESCTRADALRFIDACGQALDHAHANGVVHGDLAPGNVLIDGGGRIRLIDFGTGPGSGAPPAGADAPSTTLFASPQVLAGAAPGVRDDVFSLACLSYSALTGGRHPFGRRPVLEGGRIKVAPTRVKSLPEELFRVIESGLAAQPAERPANIRAYLRQLQQATEHLSPEVLTGAVTAALSAAAPAHPRAAAAIASQPGTAPTRRAARGRWALAAGLAAATAGAALLWLPQRPGSASIGTTDTTEAPQHATAPAESADLPVPAPAVTMPPAPTIRPESAGLADAPPARSDERVSFETRRLRASSLQPLIAVPVRRQGNTRGPAVFRWRIGNLSAHAGVDLARLPAQRVRFLDGQTERTLFIPLLPRRPWSRDGARHFVVSLEPVTHGLAVGRIPRITVTILPPTLAAGPEAYQARVQR